MHLFPPFQCNFLELTIPRFFCQTHPSYFSTDALAPDEATLEERLQIEEALCSIERFSQVQQLTTNFPTENRALAKTYATIVHLRILAHKLSAQNPSDDISEYYIALFYNAVNTLRFYSLPSRQREHALLSASLLADRLELKG